MTTITYTIPTDSQAAHLRGVMLTGGVFARLDGMCDGTPDCVLFRTSPVGPVRVRIEGRPELEAALAAHLEAARIPAWREALWAVDRLFGQVDDAADHGQHVKAIQLRGQAEAALAKWERDYPEVAAERKRERAERHRGAVDRALRMED